MDIHNLAADQRVRFPLTLTCEASLWYQSKNPFQSNWKELQERFRTQFSKIGNTREILFYVWTSFHLDSGIIDPYVQRMRQVAGILNYGEPQSFEVFQNPLLSHLYCILFQIENLRQAVKTA